ncbi:T9SS type A sorting domain-containing protein [bacterium]
MKKIVFLLIVQLICFQHLFAEITAKSTSFNTVRNSSMQNKISAIKTVYRKIKPFISIVTSRPKFSRKRKFAVEPKIIGTPLNYPNPFKLAQGTHIGYELSKDMDIEIQIYDMLGHRICKKQIKSGEQGGKGAGYYNKVAVTQDTFEGYDLSQGIYFYVIIHDGTVLGKGKMSIIP